MFLKDPTITLTDDAVDVRLHGLAAAGAVRRRVTIPYRHVLAVEVGAQPAWRPGLWKLGGVATRRKLFGTFRRDGRWLFLATTDKDRSVRLRLDGEGPERVRFAEVVLSAPDPDALAAALRERAGAPA